MGSDHQSRALPSDSVPNFSWRNNPDPRINLEKTNFGFGRHPAFKPFGLFNGRCFDFLSNTKLFVYLPKTGNLARDAE